MFYPYEHTYTEKARGIVLAFISLQQTYSYQNKEMRMKLPTSAHALIINVNGKLKDVENKHCQAFVMLLKKCNN